MWLIIAFILYVIVNIVMCVYAHYNSLGYTFCSANKINKKGKSL